MHSLREIGLVMKISRAIEFAVLFFGVPTLYAFKLLRMNLILLICLMAAGCLSYLLNDTTFDRRCFWRAGAARSRLKRILLNFAIFTTILSVGVVLFMPEHLFRLPRERTGLWVMIMFAYPIFSVYPQELIYRTFLFHRYGSLFRTRWLTIAASALAFGYAHVIFRTWFAVGLAALGGILFARTYDRTESTLASSIEHALYGCFIFTIGLGIFFYTGSVHLAEQLVRRGL